jgi:hypothetical protein
MIDGDQFFETVKTYFSFLSIEFGLRILKEEVRRNAFYDVQYERDSVVVSTSYENVEDYLQVIVFELEDGHFPNCDDKTRTHHLNQLTDELLTRIPNEEFQRNSDSFLGLEPDQGIDRRLLSKANALRPCLTNWDGFRF